MFITLDGRKSTYEKVRPVHYHGICHFMGNPLDAHCNSVGILHIACTVLKPSNQYTLLIQPEYYFAYDEDNVNLN